MNWTTYKFFCGGEVVIKAVYFNGPVDPKAENN